jgi:hypothetical protein
MDDIQRSEEVKTYNDILLRYMDAWSRGRVVSIEALVSLYPEYALQLIDFGLEFLHVADHSKVDI